MAKGSNSSTSSTTENMYGNTTTKNPYFYSKTNSSGDTVTKLAKNSAAAYLNNDALAGLKQASYGLQNPSLDNPLTQAYINQYTNELNRQTQQNLQNNIISPLIRNNMVRSSQATNMYNNLQNQNAQLIGDYTNQALINADNTNRQNYALYGGTLKDLIQGTLANQSASLSASSGNKKTTTSSKSSAK